jgi:hypothetical protein
MSDVEEIDDDDFDFHIQCQGLPRCDLKPVQVEEWISAGGCIWCTKIYFDADGNRVIVEPGEA